MAPPDGRRRDLFDQVDRKKSDNRKRKATAIRSPERAPFGSDARQPPAKKRLYPSHLDLEAMLAGNRISYPSFCHIQGLINDQYKENQELAKLAEGRGYEFRRANDEVMLLQKRVKSLESENAKMAGDKASVKRFREKKDELFKQLTEKDEFLAIGAKAIREKTEEVKRIENETTRLHQTITDRDATISKQNEQLWRITMAPADQQIQEMLQVQANQTLGMVNGLKADVKSRDEHIKDLSEQLRNATGGLKTSDQAKADLQRQVENAKREAKKQAGIAEAATTRAQEAREVAEAQEKLIARIMAENRRLGSDGEVRE